MAKREAVALSIKGSEAISRQALGKLIGRVNKGDATALPPLRELLVAEMNGQANHGLLESYGSPPAWLRELCLKSLSGESEAMREAVQVNMTKLQRDLEGPAPTALEKLLAERAIYCWLAVYRTETAYELARDLTIRQAEFHQDKIDSAHKRFLSACKTLATIRKLALPALQVNIGGNQVNVAGSG